MPDTAAPPRELTLAQVEKLRLLVEGFQPPRVVIDFHPFDLPEGYIYVTLDPSGHAFVCGISREGVASS